MAHKPSVIIFGGLNTCSRALASYLVPLDGEPLVSHLRIIDKYSVVPATTYIGSEFPSILQKPEVEYRQVNLTVPDKLPSVFEPPAGIPPYEYVFDFTGEVWGDRSEEILISLTCHTARLIGEEAARQKVKAYVRIHHPYYKTSAKGPQDEKSEVLPWSVIGTWWHETLRILGAIEGLNLVVLRPGFVYGPYTNYGIIASAIVVASIYGYLKKPMKSMWSPGKNPTNTVHIEDVAGAAWAAANWIAPLGRQAANEKAGVEIPSHDPQTDSSKSPDSVPKTQKVVAPIFNVTDDANSTLLSVGQVVTSVFGTTFEFFNFVESTLMKFVEDDHVEEVNDLHVTKWAEMTAKSNPPTTNQHLSAYMDKYALDKHNVSLSNAKLKNILGYNLRRPTFSREAIADIVEKWKEEKSWPQLN
ncbi:NAD(P)-binding protein [Macrolepiota fuliginosa MF-IS2]|uniref:NAD(P)-binding protein n=1 Tax=Macrolepiota fuliginosa MF-IS2 TaxID=1400762 RepID=A0A9P6C5T9_9AGAR|nr:NAD(P)-binding protein [Macrolepiota fuliginosa MF-IS2]